jgi:hypothetical protein
MVAPSWRPQMRDITRTLRDAPGDGEATGLHVIGLVRGLAVTAMARTDRLGLLQSEDAHSRLVEWAARRPGRPRVFRVWWNTADDIAAFLTSGAGRGETQICFFDDQRTQLSDSQTRTVLFVPYAFSQPLKSLPPPGAPGIWYPAEVDTSDDALRAVIAGPPLERVSKQLWDLAAGVVEGEPSMVEADAALQAEMGDALAGGSYGPALWTLRNRVRYLLVQGIAAAFPGRLQLRGSDWATLGFEAQPTKFLRWNRLSQYARYRVAIDLGSKSTHSWLYPRTADILAAGGGLVQFDSGQPSETVAGLDRRRARSRAGLVDVIDRVLSAPESDLAAENAALQQDYRRLRLRVASCLSAAMGERLSE